jgi:hypothetical protein
LLAESREECQILSCPELEVTPSLPSRFKATVMMI